MTYNIEYIDEPKEDVLLSMYKGLESHAKSTMGYPSFQQAGFVIRDENAKLLAGLVGVRMYGVFYVKFLWVDEKIRGKGLGTQLMQAAQVYARKHECRYMTVDTFSWQGPNFYKKLGFETEFIRDGYDNDTKYYYFRKKL